jgi:hypothetical protein
VPERLSHERSCRYYYHYLNSWLLTVLRLWSGMCLVKSVSYRSSLIYLEDNARRFCGRTLVAAFAEGVRVTRLQGNKSRRGTSNSSGLRHASLNHTLRYLTVHPVSSPNRKSLVYVSFAACHALLVQGHRPLCATKRLSTDLAVNRIVHSARCYLI